MKCSAKTMLSVAGVILAAAGAAFFAFEEARTAILASLPFLLILLCPLSMLFMMKAMHSGAKEEQVKAPARVDHRNEGGSGAQQVTQ